MNAFCSSYNSGGCVFSIHHHIIRQFRFCYHQKKSSGKPKEILIVLKSDSGLSVTHCCVSELAPFFPVSAGRGCQGFAGHCPSTFLDKQLNKEPAANINGFRALTGFL
jgi:hypothetical protein